ncbi:DUF4358 domain-containing protein [Zongyangia hominis]|uniref:DUF4358 domain-containing protein n=1 Tax=Zongyangia hominis TaxID=2763677 RepID=A0A926E8J1_9FIRM|nr:DUF4358 domain-containing protein [Zongyangia hominis]MBC8569855.1 DUF4358 domain-containing protein [Zongyangia hominis]
MKRTVALLMAAAMLVMVVFTGCGEKASAKQPATSEIAQKFKDGITFEDELMQLEGDRVTKQYEKLDTSALDEYTLFVSSSGATPEEIAVFKLGDGGDAKALKAAIDARVQQQKDGFVDYVPEEMPKLENCVILSEGNYYALVVAGDASQAEKIFEDCFK